MYRLLVLITALVLTGGMLFYHLVEKWNLVDSFYFCVVTLTTVGYGDLVPHTATGKIFTSFYILVGIGILGAFVSAFVKRQSLRVHERATNKQKDKHKQ